MSTTTSTSTVNASTKATPNGKPEDTATASKAGTDEVRILGLADYKVAAKSIAHAFEEDEMAMYFVDTPERAHWTHEQKIQLHNRIMEYVTYAHLLKGFVVAVGEECDCVALWMPPGKNMDDTWTILRSGMWRLNYLLTPEGKNRFFTEFLPLLNVTKAQVMGKRDNDSWYLVYLGTKPGSRGRGYGKKVIDFVTAMADREGRACYLESTGDGNRRLYEKCGFEVRKQIWLQRTRENLGLEAMVREPVGGK